MIGSAEEFVRLRWSEDSDEYQRAARDEAPLVVWKDVIDRYPKARVWVARNKTIPDEVIALLASDPDREVRFAVAMKRRLAPEILEVLSEDEDESVRLKVATHRATPRKVLQRLTEDPWNEVREAASQRLVGPS